MAATTMDYLWSFLGPSGAPCDVEQQQQQLQQQQQTGGSGSAENQFLGGISEPDPKRQKIDNNNNNNNNINNINGSKYNANDTNTAINVAGIGTVGVDVGGGVMMGNNGSMMLTSPQGGGMQAIFSAPGGTTTMSAVMQPGINNNQMQQFQQQQQQQQHQQLLSMQQTQSLAPAPAAVAQQQQHQQQQQPQHQMPTQPQQHFMFNQQQQPQQQQPQLQQSNSGGTTTAVASMQQMQPIQHVSWDLPGGASAAGGVGAPTAVGSSFNNSSNVGSMNQQQQVHQSQQQPLVPVLIPSSASSQMMMPPQQQQYESEMTEAERIELKKRKNAEQARRSREKKRNKEMQLQLEMRALQRENDHLKNLVKREIPDKAQQIIGECCYKPRGKGHVQWNQSSRLLQSDFELIESLTKARQAFCLSDPRLPDNPIVYASTAFLEMTGYTSDQVIGRNCRFLQGVETDQKAMDSIRDSIRTGTDGAACVINYKADGTPFWNHFFVAALRDRENRIVNYVGVQTELDKPVSHEPDEMTEKELQKSQSTAMMSHSRSSTMLLARSQSQSVMPTSSMSSAQPPLMGMGMDQQKLPAVPNMAMSSNPATAALQSMNASSEAHMPNPLQSLPNPLQPPPPKSDDEIDIIDWAELAQVLEADYQDQAAGLPMEDASEASWDWKAELEQWANDEDVIQNKQNHNHNNTQHRPEVITSLTVEGEKFEFERYFSNPTTFVTRTVRSELIDSLISSDGDVDDPRFLSALDVLSSIFKSTTGSTVNFSPSPILNGSWRSISRPSYHYGGCLGMNERGDFMYTLGKMCFNMFKPGNVRCTVQNTMNNIQPVCSMDAVPRAAPWSLRRELALQENRETNQQMPNTTLKTFDIAIALTIEPGQFKAGKDEKIPSPPCRMRATHIVHGYFLPDPEVPNRLTVWFTGGELTPSPPPTASETKQQPTADDPSSRFGGREEWIELFGAEHKRTWGESLSVMGAKLFLGAELPDGMGPDGTMRYMLHRPYGGHGKGFVDVIYVDSELLITKGNSGTLHVMIQKPQQEVQS